MPRDLTEPSFCGALISMLCTVVWISLTFFEISKYINAESQAQLIVDTSHRDDFVNVNLDVLFPYIPCDILSLDESDILGTHKSDVMGDLQKIRISSTGKELSRESMGDKNQWRGSIMDRIKKELEEKQGCQMQGSFKVYRVPGNFHISMHAYGDIKMMLSSQGHDFDFSYKINHLSFGNKQDFDYIKRQFTDLDLEHPADGVSGQPEKKKDEKSEKELSKSFKTNFYLVAVPSYFERGLSKYHVYQLISNYEVTHDE
eukprot:CAMPEP_0168618376 /NCGR_PEP_ID=MMETSP0449_2-20121227/6041_1 /TAXON_ID=1082188 /ORGANISM="Strombidium rassoulzadegani, Strain ras09" /LENGTH=257 /DNA_ID=CAMNT_0008659251 /DNA_START=34 /DNA_END=807 /DNA_ORIENTATION=+